MHEMEIGTNVKKEHIRSNCSCGDNAIKLSGDETGVADR